jgi:predicted DNA-binding transcriptional regulator AlpA
VPSVVTNLRCAVRFIRPPQVLKAIGVTLRRKVQEGGFPQPVSITKRNASYVLKVVEAWLQVRTHALAWKAANVACDVED